MQDITFEITMRKCKTKDLTKQQLALYTAAKEARKKARAPYSKYKVGAALLTKTGTVYTGANNESADYTLTNHAEMLAVDSAVHAGEKKFAAIAIVAQGQPCVPCGLCRQKLSEFGHDIEILCANTKGEVIISNINSLLPLAFDAHFFTK